MTHSSLFSMCSAAVAVAASEPDLFKKCKRDAFFKNNVIPVVAAAAVAAAADVTEFCESLNHFGC